MKKTLVLVSILSMILLCGCGNSKSNFYNSESQIKSTNNSYNLRSAEQNVNQQEYSGTFTFEGMDTVWTYDCTEDKQIELEYVLSVTGGTAKLVLITPDHKLNTIVESDNESDDKKTARIDLKKGENRIKLVAKNNADIHMKLSIPEGKLRMVGFDHK